MMPSFAYGPKGRSCLLLLLAAGLLSACGTGLQAPAPDPETAAASPAPGTISAHLNGRESFFMGAGSGN